MLITKILKSNDYIITINIILRSLLILNSVQITRHLMIFESAKIFSLKNKN